MKQTQIDFKYAKFYTHAQLAAAYPEVAFLATSDDLDRDVPKAYNILNSERTWIYWSPQHGQWVYNI